MVMKRIALTGIIVLMLATALTAGVATSSIDLLKIQTGARTQAMGGAYISVTDDLEALDINPAGLASIKKYELLVLEDLYIQEVMLHSLYFGLGMEDMGAIGISVKYLMAGAVQEALEDQFGNFIGYGEEKTGYNYLVGIGYGVNLGKLFYGDFTKNLNVGITAKLTGESLEGTAADFSNMAVSVDIGGIYTVVLEEQDFMSNRGQFIFNEIGLGFVVRNLGTSFEAEITPLSVAFGLYGQMLNIAVSDNRLRIALDLDYNISSGINARYGLEYFHKVSKITLAVRTGGNMNFEERLASGYNAGGGIGMDFGDFEGIVDYVFVPFGDIGANHKIGLYLKF